MESAQTEPRTIVVDIGTPETTKFTFLSVLIVLFIILAALGTASFSVGFLLGRTTLSDNQPVIEKQAPTTKTSGDSTTYTDNSNHFSLTYPNDWKAQTKADGQVGVLVNSQTASVELWLGVEQNVGFSAEQRDAIEKTTNSDLAVNGTKASLTEYLYKAGNYFAVVKLTATNSKPVVTFFIKSEDQPGYMIAKAITSSFKFI